MDQDSIMLHGDEEIIEVIELSDAEPGPGMCSAVVFYLLTRP